MNIFIIQFYKNAFGTYSSLDRYLIYCDNINVQNPLPLSSNAVVNRQLHLGNTTNNYLLSIFFTPKQVIYLFLNQVLICNNISKYLSVYGVLSK